MGGAREVGWAEKSSCSAGLLAVLAQKATKVTHVGSTSQPPALYFSQWLGMSHPVKTGQGSSVRLGQP